MTQSAHAAQFFQEVEDLAQQLAARWTDEHDYEDIAEYQAVLAPIATRCGATITRMIKRPFGCEFTTADAGARTYRLRVTSTQYAYQRIK